MTGSKRPLIASFFTIAGDVRPLEGKMISPHALPDRAAAAARAGFAGIGFGSDDLAHVAQHYNARDIRAILADHGLVHNEIEVLLDWFCNGERRAESDRARQFMLEWAGALGLRHIKIGVDLMGGQWPLEAMIESFAGLCDDAAEVGAGICVELFPESNIADLDTAMAIIAGAGRGNGGLCLDIWHMTRGNVDFAAIARLPASAIMHVELDDGPAVRTGTILEETIERRALPGEGAFDLDGFIRSVEATGYRGLYGVELLSNAQRRAPLADAANRAAQATRACLERALG